MLTAFNTALSALNADSTAVSVVGNNLANLNTTGFKGQSVVFDDLMYDSLNGGSTQVGLGVHQPTTVRNFSQEGTIQTTSDTLDAAINGQGFFVVKNSSGAVAYTRDGNLKQDSAGNLVNANGDYLQGWSNISGNFSTSGPVGNITAPIGTTEAGKATQSITLNANLDTNTSVSNPVTTQVQIFDSLGNTHTVTLTFTPTGTAGQWNWAATVPASDGTLTGTTTGTINFTNTGNLNVGTSPNGSFSFAPAGGAATQPLSLNFSGTNASVTQYAESSSVTATPDGNAPSQITSLSIGAGGTLVASLSNGKSLTVGQLAMASFENPDSLTAIGNNDFQASASTSAPSIGVANSGGRGDVSGSSLEASTVDISTEFTGLMTYQNAYEAASRVITTANTIEQQTIGLIQNG